MYDKKEELLMTVDQIDGAESAVMQPVSESEEIASSDTGDESVIAGQKPDTAKLKRQLSVAVTVRGLIVAAVIVTLVAAVSVLSWLYIDSRNELDRQAQRSADYAHAEDVALNYAVNAAKMKFDDLGSWKTKLVAGTSPELSQKLTKAAGDMEQILVPLQWSSSATPLAAKVRSDSGPVYVVDCFVSVLTKTAQGPEPLQSTATYSITVDRGQNWQITDVGGIGSALAPK